MTDIKSKNVQLNIISQYIKDLSFENPKAPASLTKIKSSPNIKFNLDVKINNIQDNTHEAELTINAKAASKEDENEILFLLELKYAGLFEVITEDENIKQQILQYFVHHLILKLISLSTLTNYLLVYYYDDYLPTLYIETPK